MAGKLEGTKLYAVIKEKCERDEALPLNGLQLMSMVIEACGGMGNVLDRTCENFPDYTLHDESHALRVIFLMSQLMGDQVLDKLNVVDVALLILSAYAHDLGMGVGREKREEICESGAYKDFLLKNEDTWIKAEEARERGEYQVYEHLSSRIFQDYLRSVHHELSAGVLEDVFADELKVEDKSLVEPVALLSKSHGWAVERLAGLDQFPFAGRFLCDMQFLAAVLRLADYLDLDPARAPDSLMKVVKPESEKSFREWRKHQANNFYVSEKAITFTATFKDFFEEKALRDTLKGIERERRDCLDLLNARRYEFENSLGIFAPVQCKIKSVGYVYEEFKFNLEYKEILTILMGTRLYRDERVFIRELLQNALDACRCADAGNTAVGSRAYVGRIAVQVSKDDSGRQIVEVVDNGSGMTRSIISDYFMRVGRSYYQSIAFKRKGFRFEAVSQFGIGILSCFMVADYLEVETCPDPLIHADAGNPKGDRKGVKLEIRGPHEYFVVRELSRAKPGTKVRLFLKKPMTGSLSSLVSRFLARIPYEVEIRDFDKPPEVFENEPFDFASEEFASFFVAMPGSFGYASRDLVFEGKFGFGLTGRLRFYMLESKNRRYLQLRDVGKYSFVGFGATGETLLNPKQLTKEIAHNVETTLNKVRHVQVNFAGSVSADIETILRHFGVVLEELSHQHDPDEVRTLWTSIVGQIGALKTSPKFRANVASVTVDQLLKEAMSQIESFITGQIRLFFPKGILTQDGIKLSAFFDLPRHLKLGIGYLYNLDLCGEHRVTLNAARDGVVFDQKFEGFARHMYSQVGEFLGEWFRKEKVPKKHVAQYAEGVPRVLGEALSGAFKQG